MQYEIQLIKMSLTKIQSKPRFQNISIQISEQCRNITLRGGKEQIDALKDSIKKFLDETSSVIFEVTDTQMKFMIRKAPELRHFDEITVEDGTIMDIGSCRAYRYYFLPSKIEIYGWNYKYCVEVFKKHILREELMDLDSLTRNNDKDLIADYIRRVDTEI